MSGVPLENTIKHTGGPWKVGGYNDHSNGYQIDGSYVSHLATAHYLGGTLQAKANAHLIAAAPDLLAALEAVLAYEEDEINGPWPQAVAAIAKAKGL